MVPNEETSCDTSYTDTVGGSLVCETVYTVCIPPKVSLSFGTIGAGVGTSAGSG